MNEKLYKTMGRTGSANLVMGIILLVTAIPMGVMMIVSGAGLLKRKNDITF